MHDASFEFTFGMRSTVFVCGEDVSSTLMNNFQLQSVNHLTNGEVGRPQLSEQKVGGLPGRDFIPATSPSVLKPPTELPIVSRYILSYMEGIYSVEGVRSGRRNFESTLSEGNCASPPSISVPTQVCRFGQVSEGRDDGTMNCSDDSLWYY
jgi:hypothetical protein